MAEYLYQNVIISSAKVLQKAAVSVGIDDADVMLQGGDASIMTGGGTQIQADSAIVLAASGTVFSDGVEKITEIEERTVQLQLAGVLWERPSDSVFKNGIESNFSDAVNYKVLGDAVRAGDIVVPVSMSTRGGIGFVLNTIADIDSLYLLLIERIDYLGGLKTNSDSSQGEAKMIAAITSAMTADDRTALNAVTDTRT